MSLFSDHAYFYFNSWHIPDEPGVQQNRDNWLKLPADVLITSGRFHVTAQDTRCATHAQLIVSSTGIIVSVKRGRPGNKLSEQTFNKLKAESVDITEWEQVYAKPWPYNQMFMGVMVEQRFARRHGEDRAKYFTAQPDSNLFQMIFSEAKVQPCTRCGKSK